MPLSHSRAPFAAALVAWIVLSVAAPVRAAVRVDAAGAGRWRIEFSLAPVIAVKKVAVAGSWNRWDPEALALSDADGDGTWTGGTTLDAGRYAYKFVLDGHVWIADPANPDGEDDGFDGRNSVFVAGAPEAATGVVGDGVVHGDLLIHAPRPPALVRVGEGTVEFRLGGLADDFAGASLVLDGREAPLDPAWRDGGVAWRVATAAVGETFSYHIKIADGPEVASGGESRPFLLGPGGLARDASAGEWTVRRADLPLLDVPRWAEEAVWYQIFPDRFADGDRANDPPGTSPWGDPPTLDSFSGGDLQGVIDRLGDLADLGVTAIYLNPIFLAVSNHRYDTADYLKVDPRLGDAALFRKLTTEAHRRGMRVILDGVFNHTGAEFWAFEDVKRNGAASRYAPWYFVKKFPVVVKKDPDYECWWGFGDLPKLNTGNPEVRDYLLKVATRWIVDEGADGWRLDVPNEIPSPFWVEFRRRVRAAKPDAFIVGEIWVDPSPWLQGDQFDAVMNYPLRSLVLDAAQGKADGATFAERLAVVIRRVPRPAALAAMNLLGSHDTPRVKTVLRGQGGRVRFAYGLLFALPGAPAIYYGDEVGLEGGKDPDCRRTYPTDPRSRDAATRDRVRLLARVRRENPVLVDGEVVPIACADGRAIAFARAGTGRIVVVANPTDDELDTRVPGCGPAGGRVRDLLGDETFAIDDAGSIRIKVASLGVRYLKVE